MIKHCIILMAMILPLLALGQTSMNLNLKTRPDVSQKKMLDLKQKIKENEESLNFYNAYRNAVNQLSLNEKAAADSISNEQKTDSILKKEKEKITGENTRLQLEVEKISNLNTQAKDSLHIKSLSTFGLYGIGNTNTSTFNNLNASGKLSGFIRPLKHDNQFLTLNFAYNINASNSDSLLASTFLFSDVGQNSFYINGTYGIKLNWSEGEDIYLCSPLLEFSYKNIKGRNTDSTRNFYTINLTVGCTLQYLLIDGNDKISLALTGYYANINVPSQSEKDYKYLFKAQDVKDLSNSISCWGFKIAFQYNYFQIFSDCRWVVTDPKKLPESMGGFHPNIGVTFNAQIFER
ncbi:hypothetical protein CLV51_1057 [Chitinophaga niastensis]|uniref:Outer membrane protein with beta-barrel domain n=1 Tax=Chitinophaga niastensis TaxID=536980 RepID=A0A2P8HEL1_CHINA|nr:hypothetical protein [Chitinophaga niastensis]PSL44635.1 hypothetical protein CLV51_1057 [Chitinophaga niastensis]